MCGFFRYPNSRGRSEEASGSVGGRHHSVQEARQCWVSGMRRVSWTTNPRRASPSVPDSADIYIQLAGATVAPHSVVDLGEGPLSAAAAPPLGQLSHRSFAVPLQLAKVLVEDLC